MLGLSRPANGVRETLPLSTHPGAVGVRQPGRVTSDQPVLLILPVLILHRADTHTGNNKAGMNNLACSHRLTQQERCDRYSKQS